MKRACAAAGGQLQGAVVALDLALDGALDRGEQDGFLERAREAPVFVMTVAQMHVDTQCVEGALDVVALDLQIEVALDVPEGCLGCEMELLLRGHVPLPPNVV